MYKRIVSIVISIVLACQIYAYPDRLYSKGEGLEGSFFYNIMHDHNGIMWISAMTGLIKFDGYNFKMYHTDINDTTTLNSSFILTSFTDNNNQLWIGSNIGLNLYNYKKDNFKRLNLLHNGIDIKTPIQKILQFDTRTLYLISHNGLIKIDTKTFKTQFYNTSFNSDGSPAYIHIYGGSLDSKNNIWLATNGHGILIFNPKTNRFYTFKEYTKNTNFEPFQSIQTIECLENNIICFGGIDGNIVLYNELDNTIQCAIKKHNQALGGITSITETKDEIIVGTEYAGIQSINKKTLILQDANKLENINNLNKSSVICQKDNDNDLWYAINYVGIYHQVNPTFPFISVTPKNSQLNHHLVRTIIKDKNENLLIGSDGGGLIHLSNDTSNGETIHNYNWKPSAILAVMNDESQNLWIGSYSNGLGCIRANDNTLINYPIESDKSERPLNWIFDIEEEDDDHLLMATNGSGLVRFNKNTGEWTSKIKFKTNFGSTETLTNLNDLLIEENGDIWMASYQGPLIWKQKEQHLVRLQDEFPIFENTPVYCVKRGFNKQILLGTFKGYFVFNQITNKLEHYSTANGLCNNKIASIIPYKEDEIWISTANGLSKFNPQNRTFKNFNQFDGLPFNEFLSDANYQDKEGYIYFGGVNGYIKFHPDEIKFKNVHSRLHFTNFKLFNKELKKGISADNRQILNKSINATDTINLLYSDKSFSIEFAAINYIAPEKIKYRYQLLGFNDKWVETSYKYRVATYSNLKPGNYVFNVKTTDTNGNWLNNSREIIINIKPPFALSFWAYCIYFVLITSIVIIILKLYRFRLRMQNKVLFQELEKQKQRKLNQAKFQFFTNISHDVKTPLSMISAPLQKLNSTDLNSEQRKYISYISRNTMRMQRLINQLIDIQKIDNSQLHIKQDSVNINDLIHNIISLFEISINNNSIRVEFRNHLQFKTICIDADKIDKVVYNIFSNAVKYTPKGGNISINIEENNSILILSINNSGSYIPKENRTKIFDRFYQESNNDGTGIGLHIVQKLVETIEGKIRVESSKKTGTKFILSIPFQTNSENTNIQEEEFQCESMEINNSSELVSNNTNTEIKKSKLLLVEDDLDILEFLKNEFNSTYSVFTANNGKEALACVETNSFDLIISDISMPIMDGNHLCIAIKENLETSHIPVILLTAKTADKFVINGLRNGADAYISKPFNIDILKAKVQSIIDGREKLKEAFSHTVSFKAKEMTATNTDELFLQNAIDFVNNHLEDIDLTIDKISQELGFSRTHFYRKIKALTNQSPTEFIRIIRLKHAAHLLEKNQHNISEIAYMVGFNSHQYFSTSFHKYYKMSPKEYALQKQAT
ncbi:hybrid sensor histidine kinase/response regulator transcription factor [Saccharicrinis aurantiacus]|uniref:hybrid sensor histidine kinase/response regulator transcription factor n=1 Tax=Saccharicrinis aurantiacus TaxID=1849719 RepID=UPI002492371C|nr:hybrid sensor histidine kinase/response regulator transcription factor [Saccharicrinis aurantiacus]